MINIILHKIIGHGVMSPGGGKADVVRISVPIQIIGIMEESDRGTLLHLSGGFGQLLVRESFDDIAGQMSSIARALSGQGG